jgi:hypothetical protein
MSCANGSIVSGGLFGGGIVSASSNGGTLAASVQQTGVITGSTPAQLGNMADAVLFGGNIEVTCSAPSLITDPVWGVITLPTVLVGEGYGALDMHSFLASDGGDPDNIIFAESGIAAGLHMFTTGLFSGVTTTESTGDATFFVQNSTGNLIQSDPVPWVVNAAADGWATEDDSDWLTESGDRWILE